jgi:hypothetical protein
MFPLWEQSHGRPLTPIPQPTRNHVCLGLTKRPEVLLNIAPRTYSHTSKIES